MLKLIIYRILFLLLIFTSQSYSENVFIKVNVDDDIITNVDIKKEVDYLTLLNPKLSELDENNKNEIAKKSIINEIIKKKEIEKFMDFNKKNPLEEEMLKNLYNKLNIDQQDFEKILKEKKSHNIEEIKKKLKIEIFWNDLIYLKFKDQIKINEKELLKKIEVLSNKEVKEYSLSEIVFEKKKDQKLNELIKKINSSIADIGFENTANIYSISDSAKFGGKIGSVKESNLSKKIVDEIKNLSEGQHSEVIQIGNNFLILKIDKTELLKEEIDKNKELEKMIKFETNKQLNQFSKIYFSKSKINYKINEK